MTVLNRQYIMDPMTFEVVLPSGYWRRYMYRNQLVYKQLTFNNCFKKVPFEISLIYESTNTEVY